MTIAGTRRLSRSTRPLMVAGPMPRCGEQSGTLRGEATSSRSVLEAIEPRRNLNALWLLCTLQGFGGSGMVRVVRSIVFVPAGEARPSFCAVWRRRSGGAGGGADARRLAFRQYLLGRVLSDQHAGWRVRDGHDRAGPARAPAPAVAAARPRIRRDRPHIGRDLPGGP